MLSQNTSPYLDVILVPFVRIRNCYIYMIMYLINVDVYDKGMFSV